VEKIDKVDLPLDMDDVDNIDCNCGEMGKQNLPSEFEPTKSVGGIG